MSTEINNFPATSEAEPVIFTQEKILLYFLPAIGSAISFFYFIAFLFYLGYFYGGVTNLVFSLIYLCTFIFYLSKQVWLGKHFLGITFIIQVTLQSTYLFPKEAYFQLYFLVAIPLVFMVFDASEKKSRLAYSIIVIVALAIIQLRTDTGIRPFNFLQPDIDLIQNVNIFCSFLVLSVSIYLYVRLNEKAVVNARKLAVTDALTGLYNRRHFHSLATRQFKLSQRSNTPFSLLYIDIDNFKRVNDQYGHKAGDDTLRAVAATMKNRARDSDILARVGGDEFILLLANTDTGAATALAEELLQTIEIGYQAESNRPLSVSIGLSSHGLEDKSIDCVVQRADKALYSAKSNGRNQLSVFPA